MDVSYVEYIYVIILRVGIYSISTQDETGRYPEVARTIGRSGHGKGDRLTRPNGRVY